MNFDLCDHWVIYDPLRFEKTVIAVVRIKAVLSCRHIDITLQEISEKTVEPVLMVVKGLRQSLNSSSTECVLSIHVSDSLSTL